MSAREGSPNPRRQPRLCSPTSASSTRAHGHESPELRGRGPLAAPSLPHSWGQLPHFPGCHREKGVGLCAPPGLPLCSSPRDPSGFEDWTFSTVRCWGERARGSYRLVVRDVGEPAPSLGPFLSWLLSGPSASQQRKGPGWVPRAAAEPAGQTGSKPRPELALLSRVLRAASRGPRGLVCVPQGSSRNSLFKPHFKPFTHSRLCRPRQVTGRPGHL